MVCRIVKNEDKKADNIYKVNNIDRYIFDTILNSSPLVGVVFPISYVGHL